jgi:hypothetical protein
MAVECRGPQNPDETLGLGLDFVTAFRFGSFLTTGALA